ncbi:hypothetical protein THAR02_05932 [Trichoderma harzianum]|uniref:Uncharacterized protein n=1 Tax=Trichoderma harzianum TaxID=5544 RepID=A0A0F9XBN0_TRIHA|nr:hypothetical protein THAR02_05932 [Trichoderma harzianum]
MAVFQADELEIVYEGEERREGEEEEEAKDCLLSASGLVLLKLRHELRFRRGVQEGGELGNLALVGGFRSWTELPRLADARGVAAAYQVLGNDAEQKQGGEGAKSWR